MSAVSVGFGGAFSNLQRSVVSEKRAGLIKSSAKNYETTTAIKRKAKKKKSTKKSSKKTPIKKTKKSSGRTSPTIPHLPPIAVDVKRRCRPLKKNIKKKGIKKRKTILWGLK